MKTSTTTVVAISRRRIWLLNNGIAVSRCWAHASLNQLTIFRCELLSVSRAFDADRGRLRAWSNGLQNRKKVAPSSKRGFFPNLIVPAMQALLLAAGFKVEDAHGSIIFSRTRRPMPPPCARQHRRCPCQPGAVHTSTHDPKATFGQTASEAGRAPFLSRMVESATL